MNDKKQIDKQAIEEMAKIAFPFLKEVEEEHLNTAIFGNIHIAQPILNLYKQGYRKQEWISVEERLPEENGRYLVCVDVSHLAFTGLTMTVVMEYGKSHGFYLYSEDEQVTHWMPLPQPPKGGVQECVI